MKIFRLFVPLTFVCCFALSQSAHAVSPPPDGAYSGQNTAEGQNALFSLTTGDHNTAIGFIALHDNTTGSSNTAIGAGALQNNTTGNYNTGEGNAALVLNTTGSYNTAFGFFALFNNTIGVDNIATGARTLFNNTTGSYNIAIGDQALFRNRAGDENTAVGEGALVHNTGSDNVALGLLAGSDLTSGRGNVCIGHLVNGVAGESNTTRIKNIYSSLASARAVYVNSDNKIGTLASTRRVKENIKPMDKASEAVLALKPVSFRYKREIDASGTPQFGLVAEEVADINADLVTRDAEGKPETVRYEAVNAMLLNEFLKEHKKVQELGATVAKQEAVIAKQQKDFQAIATHQQKQIDALSEGLQKVSAQLELSSGFRSEVSKTQRSKRAANNLVRNKLESNG